MVCSTPQHAAARGSLATASELPDYWEPSFGSARQRDQLRPIFSCEDPLFGGRARCVQPSDRRLVDGD
jgi:hypothetical protein